MAGHLEGAEGFTSQEDHELLLRVEKQIKRRFVIGSQVSEHTIVQDFVRQVKTCCFIAIFNQFLFI